MDMKMIDRLPGMTLTINDGAESILVEPHFPGHPDPDMNQVSKRLFISIENCLYVALGDYQEMRWSLRMEILEGQVICVLI